MKLQPIVTSGRDEMVQHNSLLLLYVLHSASALLSYQDTVQQPQYVGILESCGIIKGKTGPSGLTCATHANAPAHPANIPVYAS